MGRGWHSRFSGHSTSASQFHQQSPALPGRGQTCGAGSEQRQDPVAGQGDCRAARDGKQRRADSSGRARHDPAFVYGGEGGKGRSAEGR